VKVRDEPGDDLEPMPWADEQLRLSGPGGDTPAAAEGGILERPRGGRTDGDDPPVLIERTIDRRRGIRADLVRLGIHGVILHALHAHRLERPVPDMQRDRHSFDALLRSALRGVPA
jgi:hypothetical protein